jgi:hypothetical protein
MWGFFYEGEMGQVVAGCGTRDGGKGEWWQSLGLVRVRAGGMLCQESAATSLPPPPPPRPLYPSSLPRPRRSGIHLDLTKLRISRKSHQVWALNTV